VKAVLADNLESVRDLGLRVLSGVKSGGCSCSRSSSTSR